MDKILEIKNLTKDYGKFKLDNVSFSLPKGFIMGFIGPNGAGKTTTIKSILGMLNINSGDITVFGKNMNEHRNEIKEELGVVMDEPYFHEDWALASIESSIAPFYKNWDRQKFRDYLVKFDLDPKKKLKELSKGMKTKLMIATALCHDAKLLILDEPSSGLDPVARNELMDMLLEFISDENRGILLSSHITSDLEKVADYITFIKDGVIIFTGLKDDLLDMYKIVKGGPDEFPSDLSKYIIGLNKFPTGFSGMIKSEDQIRFSSSLLFEEPSMEEIMINIYKEGK